MRILKGHTTRETAFVVEDYPYGFRLRCKKLYWLETNKHGTRMVTMTSNPKKPGLVFNKPKAGTYCRFGEVMFLNAEGHVEGRGLSEYCTGKEGKEFLDTYGEGLDERIAPLARKFVAAKLAYDEKRDAEAADKEVGRTDLPLSFGLVEARKAFIETK